MMGIVDRKADVARGKETGEEAEKKVLFFPTTGDIRCL